MHISVRILSAAVLTAATGCGAEPHAAAPRPVATATPEARQVIEIQRKGRVSATLDQLRIRADGTGEIDQRYGGAGRRITKIKLVPAAVRRLRRDVASLPASPGKTGAPAADGTGYIYYVTWNRHSFSVTTGAIPRTIEPLIRRADRVFEGDDRSGRLTYSYRKTS